MLEEEGDELERDPGTHRARYSHAGRRAEPSGRTRLTAEAYPQSTARAGPDRGGCAVSSPDPPAFTQVGQARPGLTATSQDVLPLASGKNPSRQKTQDCPSPAELAPWVQRKVPQHGSLHLNA